VSHSFGYQPKIGGKDMPCNPTTGLLTSLN
jgi:hypothetical protein